jgi:hypothetical protein
VLEALRDTSAAAKPPREDFGEPDLLDLSPEDLPEEEATGTD